jgi:zinc protease
MGAADYDIENLGGVLNAATGADYAHYYTELPSTHVGEATAVIADIVRHATFPDAEVERERAVILDELAKRQNDQMSRIQDRLYMLAFPGKPYELSPGGQPASIRVRARDTLAAFFSRLYVPSRCTLAFAGDVTLEKATTIANSMFGDWSGSEVDTASARQAPTVKTSSNEPAEAGDKEAIGIGFPAPAARNAQQMCLAEVCAALLGSPAEGGRFAAAQWNGSQVTVHYTPHREASLFTVTARMPSPVPPRPFEPPPPLPFANLAALQKVILDEVNDLSTRPVSESALAAAINTVRGHLLYDVETDAGLARTIGMFDMLGGEPPDQIQMRLQQITVADIQQFAAEWLVTGRALVVTSRPNSHE